MRLFSFVILFLLSFSSLVFADGGYYESEPIEPSWWCLVPIVIVVIILFAIGAFSKNQGGK